MIFIDRATTLKQRVVLFTYLRDENFVPWLNAGGDPLSLSVKTPRSNSQYLCLVELLDGRFRKKDSTSSFGVGFHSLHKNAVEKRGE